MRSLSIDDLPSNLTTETLLPLLSVDLQVYAACQACGEETRLATTFTDDDLAARLARPCAGCGASPLEFVRHVGHLALKCLECAHEFETDAMAWEEVTCVNCQSRSVDIVDSATVPPFQPEVNFDDAQNLLTLPDARALQAMGLDDDEATVRSPWGRNGRLDQLRLRTEMQSIEQLPAAHTRLLPIISFCTTLMSSANYGTDEDFFLIAVLRANLFQHYFKATRRLEAGVQAIQAFDLLANAAPDEINKALMKHSMAMAVFSAIVLYGEPTIAAVMGRPGLRTEVIAGAEDAIRILEAERGDGPADPGLLFQIARVQWAIGDLMRVGANTDEDRRKAIDVLTTALADPTLARTRGFAVRQSRAETIMALVDTSDAELETAVRDLGDAMQAGQSDAAFDNQALAFFAAGRLSLRGGDWQDALKLLQRAASLALAQVTALGDERQLLTQAEKAVHILDALGVLYVQVGWVDEALALTEVLRGLTLRRHVMTDEDREAAAEDAEARYLERLMPASVRHLMPGARPSLRDIEDYLEEQAIGPVVKSVLAASAAERTALVSVTVSERIVAALVCTLQGPDAWKNEPRTWKLDDAADHALEIAQIRAASPDREQALRQLCAAGFEHLLLPIGELLAAENVTQLLLSVPGDFSGLPFEAFTKDRDGAVLNLSGREISCVLVPSLRLANDLLLRRQALPVRSADAVRALAVGYQGDDLPDVGKELDALKALWSTRLTVLDGPISRHDVLDALQGDFDVLHIMGHATHNPIEPGESAIRLVEDESRDNARVTADDLMSMRPFQRAPVVILSACSSAVTADTRTNAYHGLAGSLLRRGACGVIGSRWPVYDDAAAALMSALHGGLSRGVAPHQALRDAAAALRAEGRGIEDWAAFSYIGMP